MTKKAKNPLDVFLKLLASLFITAGHKTSSPSFLRKEKERMLAALFFFLYFLFISLDFCAVTKAIDRRYCLPKMTFFIFKKDKLGSLFLVLFIKEKFSPISPT